MDADKTRSSINLAQFEPDQARAWYAVHFDMVRARQAADKARKVDGNEALNGIQPGQSEKARAVWQGEEGSTGDVQTQAPDGRLSDALG